MEPYVCVRALVLPVAGQCAASVSTNHPPIDASIQDPNEVGLWLMQSVMLPVVLPV